MNPLPMVILAVGLAGCHFHESPEIDIFETDPGMGRPCDGDQADWNYQCRGEAGEWRHIVGEGWIFQPIDARKEKAMRWMPKKWERTRRVSLRP